MWAVFKNGQQIGKGRETQGAALADAIHEDGATVCDADFIGIQVLCASVSLNEGYEIRELRSEEIVREMRDAEWREA